ncbi:MAG: hypothetical protein KC503_33045 [Myxococcales bacterium]|nr:hypothetical protein [Myxococcales bacterium]
MLRRSLALACALLLAVGCDETTGGSDGNPPNPDGGDIGVKEGGPNPDIGGPPSGLAQFASAGTDIEVDFSAGSEEFIIVPFSVSATSADAIDFTLKIAASGSAKRSYKLTYKIPQNLPLAMRNPQLWARWQNQLAVEAWTRKLREAAAKMPVSKRKPNLGGFKPIAACTTSADCSATEVCGGGECKAQLDLNLSKFSATATATFDVKRKGSIAAILVDSGATVADADLDALLKAFEETIYPRDVALFGNPALTSGGKASDRNGDGLVWVVLTDKVSEKNNAVGFFVATDFTDDAASNKADILYMVPPSSGKPLDRIYTTMAHELEHLLNYASKVYKAKLDGGQGAIESLWLDEGLAHFAEDACGYGGENVTLLSQELFTSFGDTRMFETDSANDKLTMRAMAMTFLRYMFERKGGVTYNSDGTIADKGGAAWLQSLVTSDKQGTDNVTASYGDYKDAMNNWIAAIVLDGRSVTDYVGFNYDPLVTDPVTGNSIGMIVRGTRKDNTGADVNLQGPLENNFSGPSVDETIPNSSAKFFKLSGQTGKVKISVTTQESDFRFAVIKIK